MLAIIEMYAIVNKIDLIYLYSYHYSNIKDHSEFVDISKYINWRDTLNGQRLAGVTRERVFLIVSVCLRLGFSLKYKMARIQ